MLIRSRRDFLRATLKSVTALGRGGRDVEIRRDQRARRRKLRLSGAGLHLSGRRQRRSQYRDPHHHRAAELLAVRRPIAGRSRWRKARCCRSPPEAIPTACIPAWWKFKASTTRRRPRCWPTSACWWSRPIALPIWPRTEAARARRAVLALRSDQPVADVGSQRLGGTGWGGRIADSLQTVNSGAQFPPVTSIQGCGLFCTGNNTFPATVPPTGPVQLNAAVTDANVQNALQLAADLR